MQNPPHRKTVRRWHEPGHAHELTFSTYQRKPILLAPPRPQLLARGIDAAMRRHACDLVAFVFMPEHVHLLVLPRESDASISAILYAIKRPVSFRIKRELQQTDRELLDELTIRERPGKMTFRFWQEGGGYDRNIFQQQSIEAATHYVHLNPVRRGLVNHPEEWKWSSFRHYEYPNESAHADLPTVHGFPQ